MDGVEDGVERCCSGRQAMGGRPPRMSVIAALSLVEAVAVKTKKAERKVAATLIAVDRQKGKESE
jgi:hypothetical protein